jgi:hypothetical protein
MKLKKQKFIIKKIIKLINLIKIMIKIIIIQIIKKRLIILTNPFNTIILKDKFIMDNIIHMNLIQHQFIIFKILNLINLINLMIKIITIYNIKKQIMIIIVIILI